MPFDHTSTNQPAHALVLADIADAPQTMSAQEIADLTGKTLSNVNRDIRNTAKAIYGDHSNLNDPAAPAIPGIVVERDNRGYVSTIRLDRDHTMTVITGYDAALRHRIMRRWSELERAAPSAFDPSDPVVLLAVMGSLQAQVAAKDERIAELEPQAATLRQLTGSPGSLSLTDAAKVLGIRRKDFLVWLSVNDWTFRGSDDKWRANGDRNAAGHVEQIVQTFGQGDRYATVSVRITVAGMAELDRLIDRALFVKPKKAKKSKLKLTDEGAGVEVDPFMRHFEGDA